MTSPSQGGDFGFKSRRVHMVKCCTSGYDPQEDSRLLEKWVRQYAKGKVLDMGTGSGIQAIAAAQSQRVNSVLAVDVQKEVINYCRRNIKNPKIKFRYSDLFSKVKGKFDTIVFNPPYLPQELKVMDAELEGGKKGYEVIERFLNDASGFLDKNGIILLVFSSLTRKSKVEEFIKNSLLEFEELEKLHIFFEDIYTYMLKKSEFLKELESDGIKNVKYFTKGKRGLLFTGTHKSRKIAVKAKNPQSHAFGRIKNEAKWLERLNKQGIGPRLVLSKDDYVAYEYIEGDTILDYIEKSKKMQIKKVISCVFRQLYALDKLKADKEEMHHPLKHIIVRNNMPYMIDFERMHFVKDPKNVTQFCQFLMSSKLNELFKRKGIKIDNSRLMGLAKIYKRNMNNGNLLKIIKEVK